MNSQPVIPTPASVRWREFRMRVLPGLVCLAACLGVGLIWSGYVMPATLIGRVETIQANVVATKAGTLTQLNVARFQQVKAGDPIARVITTNPQVLTAAIAVIRAEVELIRAGMTATVDSQRNAINYEQLRTEALRQRVELATSRVNLQLAETEFQRTETLFKDAVVSASALDAARAAKDALQTEVVEKAKLVEILEANLKHMDANSTTVQEPQIQTRAAIAVQEEKLRLTEAEMSPLVLTAPIDGLVALIQRRNGENVTAGDTIITISAAHTDHIVGYLRQPLMLEPQTNMAVRVRSRSFKRSVAWGRILAVGAHLQPINDALLPPTRPDMVELGLPVLVSLPEGLSVHPGEFVDLTIFPKGK